MHPDLYFPIYSQRRSELDVQLRRSWAAQTLADDRSQSTASERSVRVPAPQERGGAARRAVRSVTGHVVRRAAVSGSAPSAPGCAPA